MQWGKLLFLKFKLDQDDIVDGVGGDGGDGNGDSSGCVVVGPVWL